MSLQNCKEKTTNMAGTNMAGHACSNQGRFDEGFEMEKFIGQGTFAKVYKCHERKTGREFAVKIFRSENETFLKEDADNEIELLKTIRHRSIVGLYASFQQDSDVFVVLELVEGRTLFDEILNQTVYTEEESSGIIQQVLGALDYIHRKRIVHRDIKADNVLLQHGKTNQNHFTVKLTDFGLARRLPRDSDVMTCDVEGAPLYLAPETVLEDPIGRPVDIWGCGVILHLLLVGFPPFWNDDDSKLLSLIAEGRFAMPAQYWDGVTDDAKDLVRRMLVVHPHKRIAASKALNHPWITDFLNVDKEHNEHHLATVSVSIE